MPIGALSNPSTLEQLQAIGVLPMGGGIASPLPQPMAPQVPPQAPPQVPVTGFGSGPQTSAATTLGNLWNRIGSAQTADPNGGAPLQQPAQPQQPPTAPQAQPQPDIASAAQNLKAMQEADSQPAPQRPAPAPQPDLYSGATVPPRQAVSADAYSLPPGSQAAPGAPPGPATGTPTGEPPQDRYARLYQSVIPGESGGDPNAKNPRSSASGIGQITDGTYASWLATPAGKASGFTMADKNLPAAQNAAGPGIMASNDQQFQAIVGRPATDAELKASWLLGGDGAAKLAAHPDAPITSYISPDAIKNNPAILSANMTGAEALQNAARYYDVQGWKGGSVQVAGPGAPTGAQGRLAAAQQASGGRSIDSQADNIGVNADEIRGIAEKLGYKPASSMIGPGDSLLATGMAMMGGRTFADSMANGSKAFLASRQQQLGAQEGDNRNALGVANTGVAMANTAANRRLQMAQFALQNDKLTQQITYQNHLADMAAGRLNNQTARTEAAVDPVKRAALALGAAAPKENLKDSEEIDAAGESAADRITQFNNLQQVARDPTTAAGAGALNTIKRTIALATGLNITADTTGVQMGDMLSRMGQSEAASAMKGLGLRTQREFDVWKEQAATLGTNPDAAAAVMQPMLNKAAADYQAFKKWHDPSTNQAAILATPNGVANFRATFDQQAAETNMSGGATVQHSPTGWTPKAGAVLRYDASGNIIQQ
jgi:hypothetical protein